MLARTRVVVERRPGVRARNTTPLKTGTPGYLLVETMGLEPTTPCLQS